MTPEREPKVFVLGIAELRGVDSAGWLDELPNLADYDNIFVSTRSLNELLVLLEAGVKSSSDENDRVDGELLKRLEEISSRLRLIRQRLSRVLATGGTVISIVRPYEGVVYYKKEIYKIPRFVIADGWQPVKLTLLDEPGDTLSNVETELSSYFGNVRSWSKVFERPDELADLRGEVQDRGLSKAPVVKTQALATDRQGHPIGLAVWAGELLTSTNVIDEVSGPFIALVPPTEIDDETAIRLLLSELHGIGTVSEPPGWLKNFEAPGELAAADRVAAALKDVEAARTELAECEQDLRIAREPLEILYEQHFALQDRCEDVFQRMGIITKPSPVSDEFMLIMGDRELLVEVKGLTKSVAQRDVSQLFKDIGTYFAKEGRSIKGVLVAATWVKLHPDERELPDHASFPANVIDFTSEQNIALLDTRELLGAYEANQSGLLSGEDFFDLLVSTAGPVKIQDAVGRTEKQPAQS